MKIDLTDIETIENMYNNLIYEEIDFKTQHQVDNSK